MAAVSEAARLAAANHEQAQEAMRRGNAYLQQGEYERANSLLGRALRLCPGLAGAADLCAFSSHPFIPPPIPSSTHPLIHPVGGTYPFIPAHLPRHCRDTSSLDVFVVWVWCAQCIVLRPEQGLHHGTARTFFWGHATCSHSND